jgi:hypothetical protein
LRVRLGSTFKAGQVKCYVMLVYTVLRCGMAQRSGAGNEDVTGGRAQPASRPRSGLTEGSLVHYLGQCKLTGLVLIVHVIDQLNSSTYATEYISKRATERRVA